jgi:hypothetical protein
MEGGQGGRGGKEVGVGCCLSIAADSNCTLHFPLLLLMSSTTKQGHDCVP